MSIYVGIGISAFIDGIFTGYSIKTGVDASPSGIGIKIIDILEPLLPKNAHPYTELYKIIIFSLPWIFTVIVILKAPDKRIGGIIFAALFVAGIVIVYVTLPVSKN